MQLGEKPKAQRKGPLTFRIQHLGNVQVLLCHIESCVQVCQRVVLGNKKRQVGGMRNLWIPHPCMIIKTGGQGGTAVAPPWFSPRGSALGIDVWPHGQDLLARELKMPSFSSSSSFFVKEIE